MEARNYLLERLRTLHHVEAVASKQKGREMKEAGKFHHEMIRAFLRTKNLRP